MRCPRLLDASSDDLLTSIFSHSVSANNVDMKVLAREELMDNDQRE